MPMHKAQHSTPHHRRFISSLAPRRDGRFLPPIKDKFGVSAKKAGAHASGHPSTPLKLSPN
jgi:hypothetical protein